MGLKAVVQAVDGLLIGKGHARRRLGPPADKTCPGPMPSIAD
jgi:hypothetical protein